MELNFTISDGTPVWGELLEPAGECHGVVVLIHGLGEHFGRYRKWAERFTSDGYSVCGADLPGHGKSGGKRGHISSYGSVGEIIGKLLYHSRERFPLTPVILYGHSLGGGIALNYLINNKPEVCCAIITSPWLKLAFEPPKVKLLLARAVKGIAPRMVQPSGLVLEYLSRDSEVVDLYRRDPLVHDRISVSLFNSAAEAGIFCLRNAGMINVPVLLMHGEADMITSPESSRVFAAGSDYVDLRLWEGGFHELHNDIIKDEVFTFLAEWLDKRVSENSMKNQ